VTYVDTTVAAGNRYSYRVRALNSAGPSAYTNIATAIVPAIPAVPTNFTVSTAKVSPISYRATLTWQSASSPTNFTIQRANNATFTTNLTSFTAAGNLRSLSQIVARNTAYYYRIRANNAGGSTAWVNALAFPIRTGP
jgi:hypothetical protein